MVVPGEGTDRIATTWVWRFLCIRCGATCSVSPEGVLARHRYALTAVLLAWCLAVARPIGEGKDDAVVYALVGVDPRLATRENRRQGQRRWRSLARWVASISTWWPTRLVTGPTWRQRAAALLAGFIPGDGGRDGAIRRALAAHTAGGSPM